MELTKEIKEILENLVYWDSCPKDYKDNINAYLKSVNESEALSIHLVMWRCTKDLFMDTGEKVFTKNKLYKQVEFNCDSAIDDKGEEHSFGEWSEFFIAT